MARKLKIWNGRWVGSIPMHIYICAHSVKDINVLLEELGLVEVSQSEIKNYWHSGCWGNSMKGIEPERGVWLQRSDRYTDEAPIRIFSREDENILRDKIIESRR